MAALSESACSRDPSFPPTGPHFTKGPDNVPFKSRPQSERFTPVKKTVLLLLFLLAFQFCRAGFSGASDSPVGRLINPQGSVAVLPSGSVSWEEAGNARDLFGGDAVKTGQDSRVSILCIDETQLKLNENTLIVLKSAAPSPRMGVAVPATLEGAGSSQYEVGAGEVWLRNKNEKARFEIQTPALTVAIRGTEFNLRVDRAGATSLVLLDGRVSLANPQGRIDLDAGEEGFAEVGKAPVKRVILQPKDAVQWSLYYPGIFSYRDIPLGGEPVEGAASSKLLSAQTSYDRGDLDSSERDAGEALARDPENGRALMVLGWISLQRQDPQKAREYFERARRQNAPPGLTVCGLALAVYRRGDVVGAYKLISEEREKGTPSLVVVMSGYFSMLVGKIEEAKALLTDSRIGGRDEVIAHSLLSQIYLAQNSKERASDEAALALRANGGSPMALMTAALVKISCFDLPAARKLLEDALAADPRFPEAYVYLARLWLGADYLDRAWKIICKAMEISKTDSEVLSLAGFIRLGYRDFDGASALFTEAVKNDPGFGEPHIGLSNVAFRDRDFSRGLTEMLTATLLEPRVSLYQSSLGKALYQTRSFDKALEVYDYAKTLDPNDPSPYLYKGIALSDLYRPGEAIQEINKSIELNDNTAIFRSRLMLDRDLAVRNADLARSYNQLGLTDWSYSKALTAVKNDPLNASAHLFLSSQLLSSGNRTTAAVSEFLQYQLLAPANENTFTGLSYTQTKDYTPMFEMPYARLDVEGGVGTWADHKALIQDHFIEAFGGLPGLALDASGGYANDPGFRRVNDGEEDFYGSAVGKFEPTIKDSFYAAYNYSKDREGDNSNLDDFSYANDPFLKSTSRSNNVDGGYVHRFSPSAVFIGYFAWGNPLDILTDYYSQSLNDVAPVFHYRSDTIYASLLEEYNNTQIQQQLKFGDHTLIGGLDYFSGSFDYYNRDAAIDRYFYPGTINKIFYSTTITENSPPDHATSVYIRDYWRIWPQLVVELGISGDITSRPRYGYSDSISASSANPAVGLNYQIDKSNTLRLAYQSYVNGHSLNPSIAPSEVAGFPSQVNTPDGSKVKEMGVAWESQWNPATFTVLRVTGYRIDDPEFDEYSRQVDWRTDHFESSLTVNRLLTTSLGLSAGVSGKIESMAAPSDIFPTGDFDEISGNIGLNYMHPTGWFSSVRDTVVHQNLGGLSDQSLAQHQKELGDPFNLVDIALGKYFGNKRGYVRLDVTNIFNQHFCYHPELVAVDEFFPDRQIIFRLGLYF